ncbi:alkaline phosphatase family protein [Candidatus Riflebacteria bacterium]
MLKFLRCSNFLLTFLFLHLCLSPLIGRVEHVVAISLDGCRADAITRLGEKGLPTIFALMKNGVSTLNARSDYNFTNTVPNHICMLTGKSVLGPAGHNYRMNYTGRKNLHQNKGSYIHSIFDVVHDKGLSTAFFVSKSKLAILALSYNHKNGAKDPALPGFGRAKIDYSKISDTDIITLDAYLKTLSSKRPNFSFVHFRGLDSAGHGYGWMSVQYLYELKQQDGYVARIYGAIKKDNLLRNRTIIILTSDHGGSGHGHSDSTNRACFTVPFIVWGRGVAAGLDLYALNRKTRADPGDGQISYQSSKQPIRNSDLPGLVARILALPAVPGSNIGNKLDFVLVP